MISVNEEYKNVLKSYEQQYDAYIILEDGTKVDTDISGLKPIYNLGEKIIGNFATKRVEFTLFDTGKYNITNKEFEAFIGLKVNNEFKYTSIGKYIADKPVLKDEATDENTIKARDYSLKFKVAYEPILTFPCSVKKAISDICEYLNIDYIENNFINGDYILQEFYIDEEATFFDVIKILVEAGFANAFITNTNKLIVKSPSMTVNYKFDLNELFELKKEDNKFGKLNSVVASRIVADDGSTTEDVYAKDESSITANGLYEYKIIQNDAIDYDRQTAVNNMLTGILNFEYNPAKLETVYNPALEVGDMLEVPDKKTDTSFLLFVKEICADLSNGLMTIESTEKTKTETDYKSATNKDKRRKTEIQVNKLEGKIIQVIEEQGEYETKISEIEQDVDNIKQRVENVLDFTREQTTKGIIHLDNCNNGTGYIEEISIRDIAYLVPNDTLTPNEYLVPFADYFTLIIDKTNRGNQTESAIELRINLLDSLKRLSLDVYDEININKEGQINLIRRIGKDDSGNLYKLDTETIELLDIITISTFEPDTYIYIKEDTNMEIYARWIIKNEFDEKYATKLELSSSITQTSQEIMSEVNKKVNEEEFATKIEQNAEAIKIAWNQISQYLKMEGINGKATLNIYDKNNNMLMSLGQDGEDFFDTSGNRIGRIGIIRENNKDTLAFVMDIDWDNVSEAKSMAWGYNDKDGNFLPIFHLIGTYGKESSEYGGNMELVGDIITNKKIGNDQSYISFDVVNLELKFPQYLKIYNDIVDLQMYADAYSNLQAHLKCNGTSIFRLYQNNNFDNVINLDNTKFFADNVPWSDDISAFTGSPNSHLIATFKNGGSVCLFSESSDKRLKENIKNTEINGLEIIKQIKHRQYNWKRDNSHENIGYIAQELEKIDKRLIRKTKVGKDYDYQINTLNVLATATKAIQELNDKVNKQEEIIDNLVKEINQLKEDINGENII